MEWIASAIAVIAALAAIWQAYEARKARTGADEASRAAAADAKRMADAMEEQTRLAKAAAEQYYDPWTYVHLRPQSSVHVWKFTLGGGEVAHDVQWEATPSGTRLEPVGALPTEMEPGETVAFRWFRANREPPSVKLAATWRRPNETERRRSVTTLTP